jgi:hypothetical protein
LDLAQSLALSAGVGSEDTEKCTYCLPLRLLFRDVGISPLFSAMSINVMPSARPVRSAFLELADAFPVRDAKTLIERRNHGSFYL